MAMAATYERENGVAQFLLCEKLETFFWGFFMDAFSTSFFMNMAEQSFRSNKRQKLRINKCLRNSTVSTMEQTMTLFVRKGYRFHHTG